jgi:hypothetical protein
MAISLMPETLAGQHLHPKLKTKELTLRSFAVLPPRIDPTGGQDALAASQARDVASRLAEAVSAALKNSGLEAKPTPESEATTALSRDYDTLHATLQTKPADVAKATFTLGERVQKLAAGADALVFVRGSGSFSQTTTPFVDGGAFGLTQTPKNDVKAWVTFVHAKNGDVLFVFAAKGKGDHLQTSRDFEKSVSAALRKLPR